MATWNTIATAVKTVLTGLSGWPTTVIRMADVVHARDDLPICVVSFGGDQLQGGMETFGDVTSQPTVTRIYGIVVSLYRSNPGNLETGQTTNPGLVLAAKQALNAATLSGASTVWNTDLVENTAWEDQPFRDGAEVSSFGVNFYSAEARNG